MSYKTISIIGSLWGDEGKGKITDYYSQDADIIVRTQGGNNAGHTIKFNGKKYDLRLIPSGIFNPKTINVLANGVVINPEALVWEMERIKEWGFEIDKNLLISPKAHIILPSHMELDQLWEDQREDKIGTTKKGIGPTYADKMLRFGIRIGQLIDENIFRKRLKVILNVHNKILSAFGYKTFEFEQVFSKYSQFAKKIKPFVISDTSKFIYDQIQLGKKVLWEGAQGVMLCIEHGTYPIVTSSSPTPNSIPTNAGIPTSMVTKSIGVTKAYVTRVGDGFFATHFEDDTAKTIRTNGNEFGTVTKRPRNIGWFDAVVLNHSIRVGGISHIAIMLLDVLSGLETLKICTKYLLDDTEIDYVPANMLDYEKVVPIYETLPGWKEDISNCESFDQLPKNAQNYIKRIEELTSRDVAIVSVGPDRKQTIIRKDLWNND